jgi:hypothetical protein
LFELKDIFLQNRVIARASLVLVAAAAALAVAPAAWAGSQLRPEQDDVVATATPEFAIDLAADDVGATVEVTTEDGTPVGSCVPAPLVCTLPAPLADGSYLWTLRFQNPFCDGYAGEICGLLDRIAGPRRFEVAVPRAEPALIVFGRSIGAARLGATRDELHALYGEPVRTRGATETWIVQDGALEVAFAKDRAVSVSTTSAYYRGAAGIGVGARVKTRLTVAGGRVVRVTITRSPAARAAAAKAAAPRR